MRPVRGWSAAHHDESLPSELHRRQNLEIGVAERPNAGDGGGGWGTRAHTAPLPPAQFERGPASIRGTFSVSALWCSQPSISSAGSPP